MFMTALTISSLEGDFHRIKPRSFNPLSGLYPEFYLTCKQGCDFVQRRSAAQFAILCNQRLFLDTLLKIFTIHLIQLHSYNPVLSTLRFF